MAGGRPTKYKPEYCETILQYIGLQGHSLDEFATYLKVDRDTVKEWVKVHPAFSAAAKRAINDSEVYWSLWLANNLVNKDVNASLTKFYFANRFGWTEKKEIKQDIQAKIELSAESAEARAIRESFEKDK